MGFEAEPLGFERQRPAAGERVMERGQGLAVEELRLIGVCGARPSPALPDLRPRLFEHRLVGRVLPPDQRFQNHEQTLTLLLGRDLPQRLPVADRTGALTGARRPALPQHPLRRTSLPRVQQQHVGVLGRVVYHLRKDHRPRHGQRLARPPEMQR